MKIFALANVKGGAGKTSTAVPLATLAARTGRTLLIDLDTNSASASQWHTAAELGDLFPCERLPHGQLGPRIDALRQAGEVDWVIIDTPAVREEVVLAAMGEADMVIIPLHTGTGDVAQVMQTHALLRNPRKGNPDLRVATVINHTGRAKSADRDTREVLEELGVAVTKTEIPDLVRYSTAKGQRPGSDMWHYENLWTELLEGLK